MIRRIENEYWESLPGTSGSKKPVSDFLKKRIDIAIEVGSQVVEVKKEEEKQKAESLKQKQLEDTALANFVKNQIDIQDKEASRKIAKDAFDLKVKGDISKTLHDELMKL